MIKVASGIYRSRTLKSPQGREIRPTSILVKQALFNMLSPRIRGARVLELFCGSGQLGIEALSNGAQCAVFVDSSKDSAALTRENLRMLGLNSEVLHMPFEEACALLERRQERFDVILADPPYSGGAYPAIQKLAAQGRLLQENGVLALEFDTHMPPEFSSDFTLLRQKSYGRRSLAILQKKDTNE